jgi:hypothetical protein
VGRYDACYGLVLKGNGRGGFAPVPLAKSGLYIPGDGKALVRLRGPGSYPLVAASQNKGPLLLFRQQGGDSLYPVQPDDVSALVEYTNGRVRKEEFYYGSSFYSQESRAISLGNGISKITILNSKGIKRVITP